MTDAFVAAALEILDSAIADFRSAIDGGTSEALNWRPAGEDTNSIAVLTVHAMHSTRSWLSVATGAALPERDRPSEFHATVPEARELLATVDAFAGDCRRILETSSVTDWGAARATHARPSADASPADASSAVTVAWALLHALEHLREHAGQVLLTRQLWEQSARG